MYRGGRDGWGANDFHNRCDNYNQTIVVVLSEFDKLFGAYVSVSWKVEYNEYNYSTIKDDENHFLFSLTDK